MINGFEEYTHDLTDDEMQLVSGFITSLNKRVGKSNAVSSTEIIAGYKKLGIKLTGARVRKIINYIRLNKLVRNLCATGKGYYIAANDEELQEYLTGLKSRIDSQLAVYNSLKQE